MNDETIRSLNIMTAAQMGKPMEDEYTKIMQTWVRWLECEITGNHEDMVDVISVVPMLVRKARKLDEVSAKAAKLCAEIERHRSERSNRDVPLKPGEGVAS